MQAADPWLRLAYGYAVRLAGLRGNSAMGLRGDRAAIEEEAGDTWACWHEPPPAAVPFVAGGAFDEVPGDTEVGGILTGRFDPLADPTSDLVFGEAAVA